MLLRISPELVCSLGGSGFASGGVDERIQLLKTANTKKQEKLELQQLPPAFPPPPNQESQV